MGRMADGQDCSARSHKLPALPRDINLACQARFEIGRLEERLVRSPLSHDVVVFHFAWRQAECGIVINFAVRGPATQNKSTVARIISGHS